MKIIINLVFVIIFPFQFICSQSMDSLWMYYYSGFHANDIVQTNDSGYFIVGYSYLGSNEDPHIASINKNGQQLWDNNFATSGYDRFRNIISTSDGNYLLGGSFNGIAWLVKMDQDGDTLWTRTFDYNCGTITFMQELSNKDLIITGNAEDNSENFYLMKTNQHGDTIWLHKYIFEETSYWVKSNCVKQTSDGGYFIAASYQNPFFSPFSIFVKTDSVGDTIWTKNTMFDLDVHIAYLHDILLDDDTVYLIGSGSLLGDWGVMVMKMTPNGEEYWLIEEYNGCPYSTGTLTNNGTIMLAVEPIGTGDNRVNVLEVDKNGNILWENLFGEIEAYYNFYQARLILKTFNNDYVISGMSHNEVFLFKFGEKPSGVQPVYNSEIIDFNISPNPISSNSTISFKVLEKETYIISLFDLNGNKIKILLEKEIIQGSYKYPINTGQLSNGVYIISVCSGSFTSTQKIIVAR